MLRKQNPTAEGDGVSWNSMTGGFTEILSFIAKVPQLPSIIASHLWRPAELAAIEAVFMLAAALLSGIAHG